MSNAKVVKKGSSLIKLGEKETVAWAGEFGYRASLPKDHLLAQVGSNCEGGMKHFGN